MNKRGITPLIATVLLIGFTVALAAVVMTWALGFVNDTTSKTKTQTENTLICASDLSFAISDINPSIGSITLDNRGQVDIISVIFRIYRGDEVNTVDSGKGELTAVGVNKFAVVKFQDASGNVLMGALLNATKVEAIATVKAGSGKENIVCPQNIQEYTI